MTSCAPLALILVLLAGSAAAQDLPGDPVEGLEFAQGWCSECHAVLPDDVGPPDSAAPSFLEVADDPAVTEAALRAFLQSSHENMPNIRLSHDQAADVIAYIMSLRGEAYAP
ncbi:MAG TPA: cytochrome c [Geminicoccus sp.]|jgi:mono/diheme cytochrome c family protein|uniref:cytochrome c n=1 Tax=Geminicoccus sp. TaxID=2024832 RepID=UPI002E33D14B|nr:cytochrome c [Geminicoccus sp.]HEX2528019.1 cytochrome c [Geminicoccus sp.]